MLNFNHPYYFHIVALEGSVKGAADRLGLTQPTISEQLRILERSLGAPLFERTTAGLRLTQRGREAFEHTTTMFLAGERLASVLGQGAPPAITLRVGVSSVVSRTVAAEFLLPLLALDECLPSIRTADFNDLLRDLRAHELDLLIGDTEPLDSARQDIEFVLIHKPVLVAIVHPKLQPADDWRNLSLLEYRAASAYNWEVDNFLREKALCPKRMGELDDSFLMLEAVARGEFVGFVPRSVARAAVKLGRVKALTQFEPSSASVHALYHRTDSANLAHTAVEQLISHARAHFEGSD